MLGKATYDAAVKSLGSDVQITVKRPTNEKSPDHEGRMSLLGANAVTSGRRPCARRDRAIQYA